MSKSFFFFKQVLMSFHFYFDQSYSAHFERKKKANTRPRSVKC